MIETEVKFLIRSPDNIEQKLQALGAACVQLKNHELNLRFDRPDGSLTKRFEVLRLRKDTRDRLTYKGQGFAVDDVGARKEIEFEVSDFDAAQAFLEALGYRISMVYEKYRTTYRFEAVEIVLDHTPLGHFVEIEGPGADALRRAAAALDLDWEARSMLSYTVLFDRVKMVLGLSFRDLTFKNFHAVHVRAEDLELQFADHF